VKSRDRILGLRLRDLVGRECAQWDPELTMRDLAKEIGVSRATLHNWVTGRTQPANALRGLLAEALHVSRAELDAAIALTRADLIRAMNTGELRN
jgi:transcriptional regulator with XRE-family HTH domain